MKSNFRHIIVMICGLFLCSILQSCNSKSDLKATQNFDSEIEQQQNLEFSLNKDLFPDSLLNRWDSTIYMEISPSVKGMFKWSSSNTIVFSPAQGFQPGTEYTATLTRQVLKYSKKKYSIDKEPIHFHTAPLRVTASHLSWTRGKNATNIMVQLDMGFNYEVDLTAVSNKIKLSSNGSPVNISAVNTGNGKTLSLQFMPINNKDEETPLKIDLPKGISVIGTKYASDKDTSFTSMIPSHYNLSITNVSAQHTGTEGVITVSTSQPILENNLKSMISLDPAVAFEVTINDGGFTLTSGQINVSQMYQLKIASGLEGAFGGKMKSDYSENITFGKLRPSISFINSKGMYLSSEGYRNLALNIINVPSVEVTVIKVYENNLEHFMRRDKSYDYHYDSKDEESSSFEYYDTENLGDTIYNKSYETSKLPLQNAAHILHMDFQDRIKDYNGVYIIRVRSKEHNWIQESKILSISDISMIVKEEKDNIYVFANCRSAARRGHFIYQHQQPEIIYCHYRCRWHSRI